MKCEQGKNLPEASSLAGVVFFGLILDVFISASFLSACYYCILAFQKRSAVARSWQRFSKVMSDLGAVFPLSQLGPDLFPPIKYEPIPSCLSPEKLLMSKADGSTASSLLLCCSLKAKYSAS